MVPRDQSTTTDAPHRFRLQSSETPRRLLGYGFVLNANKQSALGLLTLLVGAGATATPDGRLVGIPLLVIGCYLLVRSPFMSRLAR